MPQPSIIQVVKHTLEQGAPLSREAIKELLPVIDVHEADRQALVMIMLAYTVSDSGN